MQTRSTHVVDLVVPHAQVDDNYDYFFVEFLANIFSMSFSFCYSKNNQVLINFGSSDGKLNVILIYVHLKCIFGDKIITILDLHILPLNYIYANRTSR